MTTKTIDFAVTKCSARVELVGMMELGKGATIFDIVKRMAEKSGYDTNIFAQMVSVGDLNPLFYGRSLKFGKFGTSDNIFRSGRDPVGLIHGTYISNLPGIISEGGLLPAAQLEASGISISGGECMGNCSIAVSPDDVSFTQFSSKGAEVYGGYGGGGGFNLPIGFGIVKSKARKYSLTRGSMSREVRINGFVPLEDINFVFVPWFSLKEVSSLLQAHGYNHIKVLPLGFGNNKPVFIPLDITKTN